MNGNSPHHPPGSSSWQVDFLQVLPAICRRAKFAFRHLPPGEREEAIAGATALAFVAYGSLANQNRLAHASPPTLARFAICAVRGGRQVGGRQNSVDVLSPQAKARHNFSLQSYSADPSSGLKQGPLSIFQARGASPADQAAFNIDFHDWLGRLTSRDRQIINRLATGQSAVSVANTLGISPARICQLRAEYHRSWLRFQRQSLR